MGKNISYTCDFCGSTIDLDRKIGSRGQGFIPLGIN